MLMPRYPLSDEDMGYLIAYLESLDAGPDPGVTETDIHFATILTDDVVPEARKALLDVMEQFIVQKNTETRYESKRASSGPWHKDWCVQALPQVGTAYLAIIGSGGQLGRATRKTVCRRARFSRW